MIRLFPSLISADLLNLDQTIQTLEPHCEGFHLDVMDNHFVPNLTFGPALVNAIGAATKKIVWVHLMVTDPQRIIERLSVPKSSIITIHYEATKDAAKMAHMIRNRGWAPGIALSPKTSLDSIFPLLSEFDHVLIMLVEPGFSGQALIPAAQQKIAQLAAYKKEKDFGSLRIGIDGGITRENIAALHTLGAQDIAMASAIFNDNDSVKNLDALRKAINNQSSL